MARYPITVIDSKLATRLLRESIEERDRCKEIVRTLTPVARSIEKYVSDTDKITMELTEVLWVDESYPAPDNSLVDAPTLLDELSDSLKVHDKQVKYLERVAEQAQAWDQHFQKKWQELFLKAFPGDPAARMTKAELNESFELALAAMPTRATWEDKNGTLSIDLEEVFEHQQTDLEQPEEEEDDDDFEEAELDEDQVIHVILLLENSNGRAVIADVRDRLSGSFEEQTALLKQMQQDGKIVLMKSDMPRGSWDPREVAGGVTFPGVDPRLYVYRER